MVFRLGQSEAGCLALFSGPIWNLVEVPETVIFPAELSQFWRVPKLKTYLSVSLNAIGGLTSPRKPWNLIHLAVSFKDLSCACSHLVWWPMFSSLLQAPFGTNCGITCWCQTSSHYGILWWRLGNATGSVSTDSHHLWSQAIAATPTEPEWWWLIVDECGGRGSCPSRL